MSDEQKIHLPVYHINSIMELRSKLVERLILFYGQIMMGKTLQEVTEAVAELLKCDPVVAADSLIDIYGRTLARQDWAMTAWRLAGNHARLRSGRAVPPWTNQLEDEWVPLQVEDVVRRTRQRDKAPGVFVTFQCLAGTPCPSRVTRFWTLPFVRYLKTVFGFSRFSDLPEIRHLRGKPQVHNLPFSDPSELSRLRVWGLFEPSTCNPGRPSFRQVFNSNTFKSGWNRELLVLRTHLIDRCPRGYMHSCHSCHVGFSECPAGCHRHTYEIRRCLLCDKDRWCDVNSEKQDVCVDCAAQGS